MVKTDKPVKKTKVTLPKKKKTLIPEMQEILQKLNHSVAAKRIVKNTVKNTAKPSKNVKNTVKNTVKNAVKNAAKPSKNVKNTVKNTAKNTVKNTAKNAAKPSKNMKNTVKNTVKNTAKNAAKNTVKNAAIGILDPLGQKLNPLTQQPYSDRYKTLAQEWSTYPVYARSQEILQILQQNQVTLIVSGTGSGKTVIVPKLALHNTNYQGKIVVTNPKSLPSQSNAEYASLCLDVELGKEVGYQYRGSKLANGRPSQSPDTKLLFSTDGSVVAQALRDPSLSMFDYVIVDEAHERAVQIDFLLLLLKNAIQLNPKLKIVIMSATINPEIFANYFQKDFSGKPIRFSQIEVSGLPNHPVQIHYEMKDIRGQEIQKGIEHMISLMRQQKPGDILMFVNSITEGLEACRLLKQELEIKLPGVKPYCAVIGSGIRDEEKKYITEKDLYQTLPNAPYDRKIVFATNQVESSITIDGLIYVMDQGYAYTESYDPVHMERQLLKKRITQAQAKQRLGRVGRREPGVCYRLYTEREFNEMQQYPAPAISRTDLTSDVLRFLSMQGIETIPNLLNFMNQLIEPPKISHTIAGLVELWFTGAIEGTNIMKDGTITELGKRMSKCRILSPSHILFLLAAYESHCFQDALKIVTMLILLDGKMTSILDEKSARQAKKNGRPAPYEKYMSKTSDLWTLLDIANEFEKKKEAEQGWKDWARQNGLVISTLQQYSRTLRSVFQDLFEIKKSSNGLDDVEVNLPSNRSISDKVDDISKSKLSNQIGGRLDLPSLVSLLPKHLQLQPELFQEWKQISLRDRILICYIFSRSSHFSRKGSHGRFTWSPKVAFQSYDYFIPRDSGVSKDQTTTAVLFEEAANILEQRKLNIVTKIQSKHWKHLPAALIGYLGEKEKINEPMYLYGKNIRKEFFDLLPPMPSMHQHMHQHMHQRPMHKKHMHHRHHMHKKQHQHMHHQRPMHKKHHFHPKKHF